MGTPAPKLVSREVFVHIIFDPKTKEIRVDPDPFWVSQGGNEEVVFHCTSTDPNKPNPDFEVDFDENDSPFYESHFSQEHCCSGLVKRDVNATQPLTEEDLRNKDRAKYREKNENKALYKYTVTVGGSTLDPDGGVKP